MTYYYNEIGASMNYIESARINIINYIEKLSSLDFKKPVFLFSGDLLNNNINVIYENLKLNFAKYEIKLLWKSGNEFIENYSNDDLGSNYVPLSATRQILGQQQIYQSFVDDDNNEIINQQSVQQQIQDFMEVDGNDGASNGSTNQPAPESSQMKAVTDVNSTDHIPPRILSEYVAVRNQKIHNTDDDIEMRNYLKITSNPSSPTRIPINLPQLSQSIQISETLDETDMEVDDVYSVESRIETRNKSMFTEENQLIAAKDLNDRSNVMDSEVPSNGSLEHTNSEMDQSDANSGKQTSISRRKYLYEDSIEYKGTTVIKFNFKFYLNI